MRKLFVFFFFVCFASAASYAQTDVEIVNKAGVAVYSVFSSDNANPEWGDDLLEQDMLENGASFSITFPEGYSCKVDLKASGDAEDTDTIIFEDINICEITRITLLGGGKYSIE